MTLAERYLQTKCLNMEDGERSSIPADGRPVSASTGMFFFTDGSVLGLVPVPELGIIPNTEGFRGIYQRFQPFPNQDAYVAFLRHQVSNVTQLLEEDASFINGNIPYVDAAARFMKPLLLLQEPKAV